MSAVAITVDPALEPITVDEAMDHLRVTDNSERTYIGSLVAAARMIYEEQTRRALVTQTRTMSFNCFPAGVAIDMPGTPLQSITSVAYTDTGGDAQTFTSADYSADTVSTPGRLLLGMNKSWPSDVGDVEHAIVITYVCGFGLPAAVPDTHKQAIRLLTGHWFENREAIVTGTIATDLPHSLKSLIWINKVPTLR